MRRGQRSWGRRANAAASRMTERVDATTEESARRAAQLIVQTVRLLRIPTAILLFLPVPFLVVMAISSVSLGGVAAVVFGCITAVLALVLLAFGWRRHRVLRAIEDPETLASELGIMVALSDRAAETRGVLNQIAGGGGARVFSRLRGAWSGVTMTGRWIDSVGDLRSAREFAPPRIGFTVTLALATAWTVLFSAAGAVLLGIAALARAL